MTQEEQDTDLANARSFVGTYDASYPAVTVDRSRHETTTQTALWFFMGTGKAKTQIGSATRDLPWGHSGMIRWHVHRMHLGCPTSDRWFDSLRDAVDHVMQALYRKAA